MTVLLLALDEGVVLPLPSPNPFLSPGHGRWSGVYVLFDSEPTGVCVEYGGKEEGLDRMMGGSPADSSGCVSKFKGEGRLSNTLVLLPRLLVSKNCASSCSLERLVELGAREPAWLPRPVRLADLLPLWLGGRALLGRLGGRSAVPGEKEI